MLTINGFILLNIIASCHFGKNPDDINLLLNVNNFALNFCYFDLA